MMNSLFSKTIQAVINSKYFLCSFFGCNGDSIKTIKKHREILKKQFIMRKSRDAALSAITNGNRGQIYQFFVQGWISLPKEK